MTGAQPPLAERIRKTLVGLKMPRAIEVLDATIRRLERGEITALEAIDAVLVEEMTLRESRRVRTALVMARLSAVKTLAEFDFSFQPSLDRGRVMALAELGFVDRCETLHFLGPPGTGKSHLSIALGVEAVKSGRSVYFATLADLIGALAKAEREGALREKIRFYRRFALLIVDEIGHLPVTPGGGNLFFQLVNARYERGAFAIGLEPVATLWLTPHLQPRLRRMGRGLRRSRRRHRAARSPPPPRQRHPDRGRELSPAAARRPHPGAHPLQGDPAAASARARKAPRTPAKKRSRRSPQRLITKPAKWGVLRDPKWGDSDGR